MSVTIARNLKPGPTVLTPDPSSQEFIRWEGAGDPEGGDFQLVSEAAAASVPFARAVARQIIEISGGQLPEMSEAVAAHLAHQNSIAATRAAAAEAKVSDVVVREADKDLLGVPCIGPDSRGTGACGELASVPSVDKDAHPPLCARHASLAAQYIREDTGVVTSGNGDGATAKAQTRWVRVALADRERSAAL